MLQTPSETTQTVEIETAQAVEIAKRIVSAQGNIFIRELLRQKKRSDSTIRLGATKEELLSNLVTAIEEGKILRSELDAWVHEVEGWGSQHVYLYRLTLKLGGDPVWKTPAAILTKLKKTELADVLNSTTELAFPEELTLVSASYTDETFEAIWHERFEEWNRDKDRDKDRELIDGDLYEFRAYRQEFYRSVVRFVLIPREHKAALFIQIPLADKKHAVARTTARETLEKVFKRLLARDFSWNELRPISIQKAIKSLDQTELDRKYGRVQAQNTKFAAPGATVEFDADPGNPVWKNVTAVRRVRRALDSAAFTGDSGTFRVQLRSGKGMNRDVIMGLNGKASRVYLHSQMASEEVWMVLNKVLEHGT